MDMNALKMLLQSNSGVTQFHPLSQPLDLHFIVKVNLKFGRPVGRTSRRMTLLTASAGTWEMFLKISS